MGILSQSLHPSQSHLLPHLCFLGTEPALISLFRLWWSVLISEWHLPKIFLLPTKHLRCKWGTHFHLSFSSVAQLCPTLCNPMDYSTPGFPVHHQLLELTKTHVHWVGDAIQPFHPLLFPSPPVFTLSQHQGLSQWISSSHQVAKYCSFSFSISPSNEYSGLISFRMDWLCLLAVQGTLKSLLQHHSSKASVLWYSAFFIVQLSHPYMTTGKNKALTRWTFVGKVMSLLFNMLSRLVITFLPRSKCLLISWLQSPSAVILEPRKIKSLTVSMFLHLFAMKWWDQMPWS